MAWASRMANGGNTQTTTFYCKESLVPYNLAICGLESPNCWMH